VQADSVGDLAGVERPVSGELGEDPRPARVSQRPVSPQRALALGAHRPFTPSRNLASPLILFGDQGGRRRRCHRIIS
jgi:hypothetical protein